MKAVALISGGKDSCFNALHCVANGHQIVALANLHPPADQGDELDSHMYQTVGHNVIPLYAQCFFHPESTAIDAPPLPMFRRAISGTSASIGISYDNAADRQSSEGAAQEALDEVEDLFELLSEVKRAIPDVQGVSVGAILSTYQRVRVEHVCQRLGLTVLAYLWQQDQVALLDSMVRAGMNSVLIKVAAMGLNGRHLGRSLAQLQPHLLKMHADFDLHPCGEGGEYETLTLDCPLFRRRLVLHQPTVVEHSPDEMAPVLFYSFDHVTVEDKDPSELPCSYDALRELIAPSLCDPLIQVPAISGASEPEPITNNLRILPSSSTTTAESNPVVKQVGPLLTFSAIRPRGNPDSLESAVDSVMQQATSLAAQHGLSIARDAIFATVLVRNMSDFARVNAVYGKYFGINPAARACVQSTLSTHLQLDLLLRSSPSTPRSNLHVQGISYWAPANIGPYSQSVTVAGHVAIAGQIGLVPRNMTYPGLEPPTCEFATQAALARRHLERIARASGADPRKHVVGTVAYVSDAKWMRAAREVWAVAPAEGGDSDEDEDLQVLKQGPPSGLLAVVAVPCLPRNGLVEYVGQCTVGDGWQAEYLANVGRVGEVLDSDDEEDARVIAHWKGGPQQAEAHFESPGMWAAEVQARRQGAVVVAFTRVSLEGAWEVMEAAKLESVLQEVRSRLTSTLRQVKCGWEQALMVRAFVVVGEESVAAASQALQTAFHDCATSLAAVDAIETGASILLAVHGHSQPLQ